MKKTTRLIPIVMAVVMISISVSACAPADSLPAPNTADELSEKLDRLWNAPRDPIRGNYETPAYIIVVNRDDLRLPDTLKIMPIYIDLRNAEGEYLPIEELDYAKLAADESYIMSVKNHTVTNLAEEGFEISPDDVEVLFPENLQ